MNAQAGERYRCSDSNCGCEIEIIASSAVQDDSEEDALGSPNDRSIVGTVRVSHPATPHHAEAEIVAPAGGQSLQGAEGVFGTSSDNPHSTSSERLGSIDGSSLHSNYPNTSTMETGSAAGLTFSCCCGQPMRKSSSRGQSSTRVMS